MSKRIANYRNPRIIPVERTGKPSVAFLRTAHSEFDLELEAQVRSGDYFVTLATRLDGLGQEVGHDTARASLERIVNDLIYMQDNYRIMRNAQN